MHIHRRNYEGARGLSSPQNMVLVPKRKYFDNFEKYKIYYSLFQDILSYYYYKVIHKPLRVPNASYAHVHIVVIFYWNM